ncbi:MAG: MurR/RpiR family transcriptional regulator [Coriobacteriales bacterium]|nr:MurR/RpiR family transcriptional regulator [Coriobacteriales bacterium]
MDVQGRIREAKDLTPAERQLANTILMMGDRLQSCGIKELASAASCSVATVHRLCRKLGLEGFKDLKVQLAKASEHRRLHGDVDINMPFGAGWDASRVASSLDSLYEATLSQTLELLDMDALDHAANLLVNASQVDVYTQSHNLYPAQMFVDRMLSAGRCATCFESMERQTRTALASDDSHVGLFVSYSGVSEVHGRIMPILAERSVPMILVGTPAAMRRNPGLDVYLCISDAERYQNRITQFASHLAVQYVLDALFGCVFSRTWDSSMRFLRDSLPYTRKPGLVDGTER